MNRRLFLKTTTLAAAPLILPANKLFGAGAPSNKLNIALIGVCGRGQSFWDTLSSQNIVALCDVNEKHLEVASKKFSKAKHYVDWRECLGHKELDAIVVCTPDHTHALIGNWAMNRGLHVYLEKPMGIAVDEVRLLRERYLAKKEKIATQVGTQRHANSNFARVRELIRDGAIGELEEACAWGNRQIRKPGYPKAEGSPPPELNYDLWLAGAPFHPYSPAYFERGTLTNCLWWNMYWDFGTGQVGDMGCHTMDLIWNAIDATTPTAAEATGEAFNPEVTPVELTAHFQHPANSWRKAIKVSWYQGGNMPEPPSKAVDLTKIDHGAMFTGSQGYLVCDFQNRMILPLGNNSDLSYYKPRDKKDTGAKAKGFVEEWFAACKNPAKNPTSCNFEYSSLLMEQQLLGLVAYRTGGKLDYDGATGKITNNEKANAYLHRTYRDGWKIDG